MDKLIEELQAAGAGSRELDAQILEACDIHPTKWPTDPVVGPESIFILAGKKYSMPPVTKSLDAALALVKKALPGWLTALHGWEHEGKRYYWAELYPDIDAKTMMDWTVREKHNSAPIALLICLLRALQAGGRSDGS